MSVNAVYYPWERLPCRVGRTLNQVQAGTRVPRVYELRARFEYVYLIVRAQCRYSQYTRAHTHTQIHCWSLGVLGANTSDDRDDGRASKPDLTSVTDHETTLVSKLKEKKPFHGNLPGKKQLFILCTCLA